MEILGYCAEYYRVFWRSFFREAPWSSGWSHSAMGQKVFRKVVSSKPGLGYPTTRNSLWQPSSKWVPVSNQGSIKQLKERDGLYLRYAAPIS